MYDFTEARNFIAALTGSASSQVTFQVFFDPKPPIPQRPDLAATWTNTLDNSIEFISDRQNCFCGVYVCINETDGVGREACNIKKLRTFLVDFDGQAEPQWAIQPHLIQKRDETHGHAFWFIDAGDLEVGEWTIIQKQLALFYGSDNQVIDPSRVIRLPGLNHYKDPQNPKVYSIAQLNNFGHYTPDQIKGAHKLSDELKTKLDKWVANREAIDEGTGYEQSDLEERALTQFAQFAAHPAVLGSGTFELIRVASFGHDHGIPLQTTQELLWEHYNPRCEPPWEDNERNHFNQVCQRAYYYASSAPGCKSTKAEFAAMPLVEPTCGWEHQREQYGPQEIQITHELIEKAKIKDDRIGEQEAAILISQLNAKSSHYDFALAFDGLMYHGTNIIRFSDQFHRFNGKCWELVDSGLIKSEIQSLLSPYKPADSMTSGVYRCFCDLVTVKQQETGVWLTHPELDTSNYVVFNNGIVDLGSSNPTLLAHTYEFFTFTCLPYDYAVGSRCDHWHQFLTSIWGDNEPLKRQLQQWMGYCLTNDTSLQKYAIFMGKPRAGKGVITDVLSHMVGKENTSSPSLSNLVKDSPLDNMSQSQVALIPDAHNVNFNIRESVLSVLKAIVGEDMISFHRMYVGSITTKFVCKIIMSTNNIPDFIDPSGALVDRMLVFPFNRSFANNPNTNLRNELFAEVEGILQWAIAGLQDLRHVGKFVEAKESIDEKNEIRDDMFPLAQFIGDMCTIQPGTYTAIEDLQNAYRLWAMSNGINHPMSPLSFKKCLRNSALPIHFERRTDSVGFDGISVEAGTGFTNVTPIR